MRYPILNKQASRTLKTHTHTLSHTHEMSCVDSAATHEKREKEKEEPKKEKKIRKSNSRIKYMCLSHTYILQYVMVRWHGRVAD